MRIASLISSGTEILFALGLGEQVVAVSHDCDFPPAARRLPQATRSLVDAAQPSDDIDRQVQSRLAAGQPLYELDADLLCRLAPELIVTQAQCDVCAVRYASVVELVQSRPELQAAQVLALNPQSLAEVVTDIGRIGRATEAAAEGQRLQHSLQSRIDTIARQTDRLADGNRPRVVCIEWILPLMAAGNWTPELIELAGGRFGLAEAGRHSGYITSEQLREFNPDVLLVAPCGFDLNRSRQEAQTLCRLPGFDELAAVQSGRAFVIDGNAYLNRSGPRLVESLEIVAHLLHPAVLPRPNLDDAWRPLL